MKLTRFGIALFLMACAFLGFMAGGLTLIAMGVLK